jgi:hypothetical protein
MSLPSLVRWVYDFKPEPGSIEEKNMDFFKPEGLDLMFCRYLRRADSCRQSVLRESVASALDERLIQRVEEVVARYRLNTPYPYFGLLLAFCLGVGGDDTSAVSLTTRKPGGASKWIANRTPRPTTLIGESLSIVVENTGKTPLHGIPIELHAVIEPQKMADVVAVFPGDRELLIEGGQSRSVALVLSDAIAAGAKRRYVMDEIVQTQAPFKVTLKVIQDNSRVVLADHTFER